jgi:predicted acylesterase/phospholipase RssA
MNKKRFVPAALAAMLGISAPLHAQQAPYGGQRPMPRMMDNGMPYPPPAPMKRQFTPPAMPEPPVAISDAPPMMPRFPTPEELQQMMPPEPLTEEQIRQRFEERKQFITEMMERDRKAAERYAQDFARYQKYQSEQLAEIMKRAEAHRKAVLERLDRELEQALKRFEEIRREQEQNSSPVEKPSDKQ